ncbi:serine threonine- kinase receptor R831 [Chlorella sorokiniana]|uniref:Serine threonine-kinase receptor R831 n=1 Tax=Chlorella sorokiniana TaxID=3076 RepID=A0A2P6TES6_CHLSO|nr:serine threonine- kinase receptor R831 [Chlorella sorokiniana]|eukprot:PRW21145.1 serine threonine- kinase receptor R831 [Chlorella sorokiniana]
MSQRRPSQFLRILVSVLVLVGGAAAACGPAHTERLGRRLLQGDAASPSLPASSGAVPAPSPDAAPTGSTIIVDEVVDQKCSMMHRALVAGTVLRAGAVNMQSDETACCRSCLADDRCTAWVYCPDPAGCNATEAAAAAAAAASSATAPVRRDTTDAPVAPSPAAEEEASGATLFLPHRGCRLLSIPAFRLRKDSPQVVAKGTGVPYISGTPVSLVLPALPGFSVRPGTETQAGLGYKCEGSLLLHSCMLQAPVEELAAMCNADPMCKAFVYLPNGLDSLSEPIGIFKGGPSIRSLPVSALQHNPSTALYIKDGVETTAGGPDLAQQGAGSSGSSSRSEVLWIVLPVVLAAALFMLGGVAFYAAIAMRRAAAQRTVAAAAADQQQPKAAAPSSKSLGAGQQPQQAGGVPPLVLHAVKPSPPDSGGSGGSATPSEAGHSPSAASACSTGSVQCPQCGSSLSIRYRRIQSGLGQPPTPAAPRSS